MRIELALILQIILESLPVSSSGNLVLLGMSLPELLNYSAHIATLMIYIVFFRKKLCTLFFHPLRCFIIIFHACLYALCALIPTIAAYTIIKMYGMAVMPLWIGFLITALALISVSYAPVVYTPLTCGKAFLIGCAQGCAILPGISRFAATYVTARWLGLSWRVAFAFSCMIEAPLLIIATGIGCLYVPFCTGASALLYITATIISYVLLCMVYVLAEKNKWWIFAIYVICLAIGAFFA